MTETPLPEAPAWRVLHVKPRCEKKLAEYVAARGIEHYLPLREETKIYQRRKVTVQKPVFPGYLFVAFAEAQRVAVLKSNQVVRILRVEDQARFLHAIEQVRRVLAVDPTLGACAAFQAGRRVRIAAGPFAGVEGVVQTVRGQARVVLNVEIIGQAIPVEADTANLEPLS